MIKIIDDIKFMPDMGKSIHYISWTPCHAMHHYHLYMQ